MSAIQQWDEGIVLWIREHIVREGLDSCMKAISFLGNGGIFWILLVIGLLLLGKQWRHYGICLGISLASSACITNLWLKPWVARIRPYDKLGLDLVIPPLSDYSFPSGHTTAAFASAVILWQIDRRIGFITLLFACAMAFSRVYLAVHYLTDVLAGALIGSFCSFLFWNNIQKKQ